jgi:hypothetical protein
LSMVILSDAARDVERAAPSCSAVVFIGSFPFRARRQ